MEIICNGIIQSKITCIVRELGFSVSSWKTYKCDPSSYTNSEGLREAWSWLNPSIHSQRLETLAYEKLVLLFVRQKKQIDVWFWTYELILGGKIKV